MLNVFAPYGRRGASTRVRVCQWLERVPVEHILHDYAAASNASPRALLTHPVAAGIGEYHARSAHRQPLDTVLVQRGATPFSRGGVEAQLLRSATLGIYDFDDALQWEAALGRPVQRIFPPSLRAIVSVQTADRVIAGNATLADWASASAHDVRIIPSCVEPALYRRKQDYTVADPPLIGWIGSASTEPYLETIAAALREVHVRTGALLAVIGTATERAGAPRGHDPTRPVDGGSGSQPRSGLGCRDHAAQ